MKIGLAPLTGCSLLVLASACAAPPAEGGDPAGVDVSEVDPQGICDDCESGGGGGGGGGTTTPKPELAPVPTLSTYCARDAYGNLVVKIRNSGTADAPSSTTRVTWHYGYSVDRMPYTDVATGAIAKGTTRTLTVPMPVSCFDPQCTFTIMADVLGVVAETNETNNSGGSTCP